MIYLDSNVFIYPIIADEKTEMKSSSAKKILLEVSEGKLAAATCTLTWDELTWIVGKFLGSKMAIDEGNRFLDFPNLTLLSVDENVIKEAQRISQKYKLRPRDAIHVASALENGIKEIISDDSDLDVVKEITRIRL